MGEGLIDKEMFYRISPIVIELPPLRNRREDIPLLIEKFLSEAPARNGAPTKYLSPEALRLCLSYEWPGNVLHLKNAIEYASIMTLSDVIRPEDLPTYLHDTHPIRESSVYVSCKKR
jgi:DNA-binding NtrC family response regulator